LGILRIIQRTEDRKDAREQAKVSKSGGAMLEAAE
jgi:hypothetical protein